MTDTPPLQFFQEHIDPLHDCSADEDCSYPAGMYLLVMQDPDQPDEDQAFLTNIYLHRVSAAQLVGAAVQLVDQSMQDNRGDDMAMIAHTRGRDLLRAAVEQMPPPPAVSEEITHFAEEHLSAWKGLIDG